MKKRIIITAIAAIFLLSNVLATFDLFVRNLDANTSYSFTFNLTTDAACSNVLLSHNEVITSSAYGDYLFKIDLSSLTIIKFSIINRNI